MILLLAAVALAPGCSAPPHSLVASAPRRALGGKLIAADEQFAERMKVLQTASTNMGRVSLVLYSAAVLNIVRLAADEARIVAAQHVSHHGLLFVKDLAMDLVQFQGIMTPPIIMLVSAGLMAETSKCLAICASKGKQCTVEDLMTAVTALKSLYKRQLVPSLILLLTASIKLFKDFKTPWIPPASVAGVALFAYARTKIYARCEPNELNKFPVLVFAGKSIFKAVKRVLPPW